MRARVGLFALCAAVAALVTSGAQGRGVEGTTLVVDLVGTVTLDPAFAVGTSSWQYQYATGLKLFNLPDKQGAARLKPVPEAAAGFKISDDGLTYTFTLAEGYRFSDAKPVTAASFAAALQRTRTQPALPGSRFLSDVKGVKATGNKLAIKLKHPAPDFLARMAMPFFSAIPTGTPATQQTSPRPTAGPYFPKQFGAGNLSLARNPFYGGKRPQSWETILLNLSIARDRQLARCEAGQADVCSPPDEAVTGLASKYGVNGGRFFVKPTLTTGFLMFNHRRPLFRDNGKLKQAVNFAIDRTFLVGAHGPLAGRATDQILPPGLPGFRDASLFPLKSPNVSRARALARGNARGGTAVFYAFDSSPGPAIAQVVQFNLKQIGIDVEVKTIPTAQYAARINAPKEPFDMAVYGWGADYPDPYNFINVLLAGKSIAPGTNRSYFDDPAYNRRIDDAAKLSGPARYRVYGQLDVDVMRNRAPLAPYVNTNARVFVSADLGCYTYHPLYGTDWGALCRR